MEMNSLTGFLVAGVIGIAIVNGVLVDALANLTGLSNTIVSFIIPLFAFAIIKVLL